VRPEASNQFLPGNSVSILLAVNVTLLTFAAERRAAAPLLLSADHAAIDRCLLPAVCTAANPQQRCAAEE